MKLLINRLFNVVKSNALIWEIVYTLWGVLLLFATAQVHIPLDPVPITLQTVGVMLIGLTFPPRTAMNAVLIYLAMGAMGMPVFAGFTTGLKTLSGPRGGYHFGFLAAVAVMTLLRQYLDQRKLFSIAFNGFVGTAVIFIFGIIWLAQFTGFNKAIQVGFMPFILPGIIKIILLALCLRLLNFGYFEFYKQNTY